MRARPGSSDARPARPSACRRFVLVVALLLALVAPAAWSQVAAAAEDTPGIQLKTHQSAFVTLPGIDSSPELPDYYDRLPNSGYGTLFDWCEGGQPADSVRVGDQVLQPTAMCRELDVDVVEDEAKAEAWRLRVAIDTPNPTPVYDLELWGPLGVLPPSRRYEPLFVGQGVQCSGESDKKRKLRERECFDSAEVFYYDPPPGRWRVRVIPVFGLIPGTMPEIRVRAKLEAKPQPSDRRQLLLPDLRPELPLSLSLHGAGNAKNCRSSEDTEPPAADQRCLRFAFGYQNVGLGPLELDFQEIPRLPEGIDSADDVSVAVTQRVFRPANLDGSSDTTPETYADNFAESSPAGTATYHKAHSHFHYDNILYAELFEVLAPGVLKQYGVGAKRGTCAHDGIAVEFRKFRDVQTQADSGRSCLGAGDLPGKMRIGLSAGWGDVYAARLADNYVAFPEAAEIGSQWVLRVSIDHDPTNPTGLIRETDETNNVAFVHFEVLCALPPGEDCTDASPRRARRLLRARGADPWDPAAGPHLPEYGM